MEDNKVSIIMNCYNGDKFLSESIESVISQTYQNWELIFWDNKSVDRSREIFEEFSDERLKYYSSEEHTTLGEARNLAIEKATGDWIAFLDVDDLIHEDKLEKQLNILRKHSEVGFIYGKTQIMYMSSPIKISIESSSLLPTGFIFKELLKENFVNYLSALISREKLMKIPRIPSEFSQVEDYYIFLNLSKLYKVIAMDEFCCTYRIHGNNLSRNKQVEGAKESLNLVKTFLPDPNAKSAINHHMSYLAIAFFREGKYCEFLITLFRGAFLPLYKKSIHKLFKLR